MIWLVLAMLFVVFLYSCLVAGSNDDDKNGRG